MTSAKDEQTAHTPPEPPSLEALVRRFLDLWQSQVAAVAADPETNLLLGRLIEAQIGAADAIVKASQAGARAPDEHRRGAGAGETRAEAAAAPSHDGEHDVAELARRLTACEKRLARMER